MKEKYIEKFIEYLNQKIDFSIYDKKFEESNLYINPVKNQKNMNSKYYTLLNIFYVDKLDSNSNVDISFVEQTYKSALIKDGNVKSVMYNPPSISRVVENGNLVLEFSYGKTNKNFNKDEYTALVQKQREFIDKVNLELEKNIENKLNIKCNIFVEKTL